MFQHLVVPIDGSPASLDALPVALRLARASGAAVEVVGVYDLNDVTLVKERVRAELERLGAASTVACTFYMSNEPAGEVIGELVTSSPGALIVMSSHGRGKSAAIVGSVADDVLRAVGGPVVMVGPNCESEQAASLSGAFVVPLDGSERAERMVPVATAWSEQLGGAPWLVCSTAASQASTCKAHYLSPLAREVRGQTSSVVQYEVIEDSDTAASIVAFARLVEAPLIFMSTHGRTGLSRLRSGSVAAEVLRNAHCPVVMVRPADLTLEPQHTASMSDAVTPGTS